MYKKVTVTKDVEETHKYCDMCGVEMRSHLACGVARCEYCGKDLCDKCVGHEDYEDGDYRTVYCERCWKIGEEYVGRIKNLENRIEKLYDEWEKRCKVT